MSPYRQRSVSRANALRYVLLAVAVTAVLGLFVAGFYTGTALGLLRGPAARPQGEAKPQGEGGQAAILGPPAISDRTPLEFTTTYAECGCTVRETRLAGMEMAGLTEPELAAMFPGWTLQSFGETGASFYQLVPGLCPEMRNYRTLGVHEGRVAVFLGRPGTGLLLQRLTGVAVLSLPPADRERLANGIVLEGDAAVERFLEGLPD